MWVWSSTRNSLTVSWRFRVHSEKGSKFLVTVFISHLQLELAFWLLWIWLLKSPYSTSVLAEISARSPSQIKSIMIKLLKAINLELTTIQIEQKRTNSYCSRINKTNFNLDLRSHRLPFLVINLSSSSISPLHQGVIQSESNSVKR